MKERPIIFTGDSVRAILDGRKTQTRRVVKPQPNPGGWDVPPIEVIDGRWASNGCVSDLKCPYGKPGDRLWVRETWQPHQLRTAEQEAKIKAWFDKKDYSNFMNEQDEWAPMPNGEMSALYAADYGEWAFDVDSDMKPWKPSIFMPRWASRITLEITNVRVERLQEISGAECDAEGVIPNNDPNWHRDCVGIEGEIAAIRKAFAELWDEINGKTHPWKNNPLWVWVIEFNKI